MFNLINKTPIKAPICFAVVCCMCLFTSTDPSGIVKHAFRKSHRKYWRYYLQIRSRLLEDLIINVANKKKKQERKINVLLKRQHKHYSNSDILCFMAKCSLSNLSNLATLYVIFILQSLLS